MRKLIVSNFLTLDGYYESKDKTFNRFFDYYYEGYGNNQAFDEYNVELLRGADTLVLSCRTSFLGSMAYWSGVPADPEATSIRLEYAELISAVDKIVVSDNIEPADRSPWEESTRIARGEQLYETVADLKEQP